MVPGPPDLLDILVECLTFCVGVSASGRFPGSEEQGGTVEGAVGFLVKLSLFNLFAKIFVL